jgi:FG-GAP-like repeat
MRVRTRILAWFLISLGFAITAFTADSENARPGAAAEPVIRTSVVEARDGRPVAPPAQAEAPLFLHPPLFAESQTAMAADASAGTGNALSAIVSNLGEVDWYWYSQRFTSSSVGEFKYYYIDVPSGANSLHIGFCCIAPTADADLFVQYGAKPDSTHWDCRPNLGPGVNENCDFAGKIRAGRWWFALRTAAPYSTGISTWASTNGGVKVQPWDFNPGTAGATGDGMTDIVWHNTAGYNAVWFMNTAGVSIGGAYLPSTSDPNWQVVGAGDFNGDGIPDVVVRNPVTGQNAVWFLNGSTLTGSIALDSLPDPSWEIVSVADMNSDGMPDLVWRNKSTGSNAVWLMNGVSVMSGVYFPTITDTNWRIAGIADFNNDGKPDILWRNNTTGAVAVWYMNDLAVMGSTYLTSLKSGLWDLVGVGDMDGDGVPDLIWRDGGSGANAVWLLNYGSLGIKTAIYLPSLSTDWIMTGPR